eukprot:11210470-Lingulodinium_polyedra.AAC.1
MPSGGPGASLLALHLLLQGLVPRVERAPPAWPRYRPWCCLGGPQPRRGQPGHRPRWSGQGPCARRGARR